HRSVQHSPRALLSVLVAHPAPAPVPDEAGTGDHAGHHRGGARPQLRSVHAPLRLFRHQASPPAPPGSRGRSMMPDNWGFVLAAYGLAAVVLITYWRFLSRREKEIKGANAARRE